MKCELLNYSNFQRASYFVDENGAAIDQFDAYILMNDNRAIFCKGLKF